MDFERIERALREGPVDEPVYVPGAFRRRPRSPWFMALAGAAVGAAVVVGVVIGLGLGTLRGDGVGDLPRSPVTSADLQGRWVSDEIPFQRWVDELTARGFDSGDVDAFLVNNPFRVTAQYVLVIQGSLVFVRGVYDGAPPLILSSGEYTIEPDGTFDFVEVTTEPPTGSDELCGATADIELDGDRLRFDVRDLPGCDADEAIAHTLFFDLVPYTRAP